jgi:iron-sulfur cluster repair protein YtfE (RIC family)
MSRPTTASHAREELATQHAMLREIMDRCEALADGVDAGTAAPAALLDEVARLRAAFDQHNQFEEQVLHPLLADADWLGAVRISRMVEDHVQEHRAMRRDLHATPTGELRAVIANLRDHLAAEEHYLLSRKVLRDDLDR